MAEFAATGVRLPVLDVADHFDRDGEAFLAVTTPGSVATIWLHRSLVARLRDHLTELLGR